jgi:hypothetical protein
MAVTAWTHPTAADSGGDFSGAANATEDDTTVAQPGSSGGSNEWTLFKNAAETSSLLDLLPSGLTSIDGIEVRLRALDPYDGSATYNEVSLSHNGGTNFTSTADSDARNPTGSTTYGSTAASYTSGGATADFGRTWSRTEFSDANFVFQLTAQATDGFEEDQDLEFIELRVHYTESGGTQFNQSVSGSMTMTGLIDRLTGKGVSGSSTLTGAAQKDIAVARQGSMTATGQVLKSTDKTFSGSFTPAGVVTSAVVLLSSVAGTFTPSGVLGKRANKLLSAAMSTTGALAKSTSKLLNGDLTPTGQITKLTSTSTSGSVTLEGTVQQAAVILEAVAGVLTGLAGALAASLITPPIISSSVAKIRGWYGRMIGRR